MTRRRPALDFSITGVVYVGMMLFMGLAAINSQANLLFGVFGLMIGILIVSGMISRIVLRRVRVQRLLPDSGCVGRPMSITYNVTNGKRFWPSLSLAIAELDGVEAFTTQPQGYMMHAAPRMTASVPAPVIPKRRGLHALDRYQVATSFPFGFVKRAITVRDRDVMLIHPPLAKVHPQVLQMCRSADVTGEAMRPRPGGSDEFYGVKEYRAGDNPRWIYWRRSARAGALVSKEMTQVSPPRILLLVDTCLSAGASAAGLFAAAAGVERCIAMAASLGSAALDQGLSVGLCAWSGDWVTVVPTRGKRHREDLLSVLAQLPRNTRFGATELIERSRAVLHAGTTAILFTPAPLGRAEPEAARRMLVIPADSSRAAQWFQFEPAIDFTAAMPPDQRPVDPRGGGRSGFRLRSAARADRTPALSEAAARPAAAGSV